MKLTHTYIIILLSLNCIAFPPSTHGILASSMSQCDADAVKYITLAGVTSETEKTALCNLAASLKSAGLWGSVLKAFYPFVGADTSKAKFNLISPYDADSSFRGKFSGGWTINSMGADPNGSSGYFNTYFDPSYRASVNGLCYGVYSRENNQTGNYGVWGGPEESCGFVNSLVQQSFLYKNFVIGNSSNVSVSYTTDSTTGCWLFRRTSNTFAEGYRNGVSIGTTTGAAGCYPYLINNGVREAYFYFGARKYTGGGQDSYSTNQLGCAFLGLSITDQQAKDLTTIILTFITALGRNV